MDKSFPFRGTASTTLSTVFFMDAGSRLRGCNHRQKEEGGYKKKKTKTKRKTKKNTTRHFVLLQDVLQFGVFPSGQTNRLITQTKEIKVVKASRDM